ncbi:MAG: hypothetical protein N3F63_03505 [Thermoplasmata archaeon]|nr:hypothetical protein [Thermoplasmata archaeon]
MDKHTTNHLTHVVAFSLPVPSDTPNRESAEVHLLHSGWRNSPEWDEVRQGFSRAWTRAFKDLEKYVNGGQGEGTNRQPFNT